MSHQRQLEKSKYRNWVRGGLAYKYFKEGIEGFADDVVQKEHTRIIGVVNNTSRNACDQCDLNTLKPIHTHVADPTTGKKMCMWGQSNCKCLYPKTKPCPNKVCDVIMEEILKSHGSTPPTPNWKSTDVHKWYSSPWEIAKCFINAPGYSDKTSAADIDINGLLHVFINNINLHSHLSCNMTGTNIFIKSRERRNKLFHSPAMELEDASVTECIDDIISILEDPKELASTANVQQTLSKLKQLKQKNLIITTHNEAEVCRAALDSITKKTVELNHKIQEAKDDINRKHADASKAIDDKVQLEIQDAFAKNTDINILKQSVESLTERVNNLEEDNSQIKMHLLDIDTSLDELKTVKDQQMQKLNYVEDKQALQDGLVKLYQRHYVKTSLSPLKLQENDINIDEVYVSPKMVDEADTQQTGAVHSRYETDKQQEVPLKGYDDLFESNGQENKTIYIVGDVGSGKSSFCKKMIQDWCTATSESPNDGATGDVSDESRINEMTDNSNITRTCDTTNKSKDLSSDSDVLESSFSDNSKNLEEMRKFDFLFNIPLQKMSKYSETSKMIQAICTTSNLASADFIERVFKHDSERCLIIIDGLDEWRPQQMDNILSHESYGLPFRHGINNATVVTLSRPSAKGMLNIKRSEFDKKVELKGISLSSVNRFIEKYLAKLNKTQQYSYSLMEKIHKSELKNLENNPLLLQQLVWLYYNNIDFGKSVSEIYCHLVNIMFSWFQTKTNASDLEGDCCDKAKQYEQITLPPHLNKFSRCRENKRLLIQLAKVSFELLTSETEENISFNRSHLIENGFSKTDILLLIDYGILIEENCYDPTQDRTQLSFIHTSYLEFFAAVYVSCQCDKYTTVLKDLFKKCETATDILQLSNLLKMICGLCPFLISQLSHSISEIVKRDETIIRHNSFKRERSSFFRQSKSSETHQIQQLVFSCFYLCDTDDKPMMYLSDVYTDKSTEIMTLRSIMPDNVIYLHASDLKGGEILRWVTLLNHLQYVYISFCEIPHDHMTLLTSFVQEASLRFLSLAYVKCAQLECRGHSIDLSKHDNLQQLKIFQSDIIRISDINTEPLVTIDLDSTHTLDIGLLQNARNLTALDFCFDLFSFYPRPAYTRQVNSVVQTLSKLQTLSISHTGIVEFALKVTPEMRNLKHIQLKYVSMRLETWRTFVDSLLNLQQSVQVDTSDFSQEASASMMLPQDTRYASKKDRYEYVWRLRVLFDITEDSPSKFAFRRRR